MKSLEEIVTEQVTEGIKEAVKSRVGSGYGDSGLNKLIDQVVASRQEKIRGLLEEAFDDALKGDFRENLKTACSHKLAKIIVSKCEGEIERRANDLRSSPEFRAKVTLAIEKAVKEAGK